MTLHDDDDAAESDKGDDVGTVWKPRNGAGNGYGHGHGSEHGHVEGGGGGYGWGELELGPLQNLLMPDNCLEVIPMLSGSALTNLNLSRNMLADGIIEVFPLHALSAEPPT